MSSTQHRLLMCRTRTCLLRGHEPRADPDGLSAVHEVRCESTAVVDGAGADDVDGLAGEWGFVALDGVDAGGNEDRGGDIAACIGLEIKHWDGDILNEDVRQERENSLPSVSTTLT